MNNPLVVESATLSEVWTIYKKVRLLKPMTILDYEKKLRLIFKVMTVPIDSISKQMLLSAHMRLSSRHGLRTASYVISIVSALIEFAIQALETPDGSPVIEHNPARIITATRANRKPGRLLQAAGIKQSDLPTWFAAVQRHPQCSIRDWLVFMLLTGARRTEATELKCSDVFGDSVRLGGRVIPMSDSCASMIARRLDTGYGSPFLFPGKSNGKISDWNKTSLYVSRESGVSFTPYQLRLTYKEIAIAVGIPLTHIDRLMRGNEAATFEQLNNSQQLITNEIARIVGFRI